MGSTNVFKKYINTHGRAGHAERGVGCGQTRKVVAHNWRTLGGEIALLCYLFDVNTHTQRRISHIRE